jgi:hypothetical protein
MFHVVLKARTVTMILTREAKTSLNGKFAPRSVYITASDMIKIVLLVTGSKQELIVSGKRVSLNTYIGFERSYFAG